VNRQKEPVDGPIEYQDATSVRQTIIDRLERLSQCNRRLDRFWLPVGDWQKSRDWYRRHLGFEVDFEIPDRKTVAMRAGAYLTMFLFESEVLPCPGISFAIPVDDVDAKYEELIAEGIPFIHPPMKVFWGYGAELCDPDGYRFRLWDEKSMKEKGSA
jgi:catechol 2,3-dioxygenase-like lactoylglutathione lyase family enzyme